MQVRRELVAKLIFASSQLRYFEKRLAIEPDDLELKDIVVKYQVKVDEVLAEMDMQEFVPLKTLIETLNI